MQAKTLTKVLKPQQLEKMLYHFEAHNFIKSVGKTSIQLGFLSENLKEFIKKEWLLANLTASDLPAFSFKSLTTKENLKTALDDMKSLVNTAPFSLVEVNTFNGTNKDTQTLEPSTALELIRHQFKNETGTILRNLIFCSGQDAQKIFYQKQREHKIWWRKFSAMPGRFIMSNTCSKENEKAATNEIQAEFPWGVETVESIKYLPDFCVDDLETNKSKRKKSTHHVIACEVLLEKAAFTYLFDSYEGLEGEQRDVLNFNKKLAPYKLAIAGSGTSSEEVKSLNELSLLLAKQVRNLGFPVLFLPDAFTTSVQRQVLRNDAMGVPYTLLLNEKTLKDGSVALRSRDTTLEEQSHVSLIAEYMSTILK